MQIYLSLIQKLINAVCHSRDTSFTEKTLDEIIQKAGGTKYISFKFGDGFKKGDSYLSRVFRLSVFGKNENTGSSLEVNLIVKGMPENINRRKVFRSADFFRNEVNFYMNVIPSLEAFQNRRKPKNPLIEYPICYAAHCDGQNDFIALADVSFEGYKAPNRQEYISLEECLLSMRTLGRFHGIALAFHALEPTEFNRASKHLEETYYAGKFRSWYEGFLGLACTVAKDAVSKVYPGSKYEKLSYQFLQPSLYDDLIKLVSAKTKYAVFGHGDCWTPNFLTKYSENNEPQAIKIIDFQLTRLASLALDISFFIYSCTSQELREKHYNLLLQEYHNSASNMINDLGGNSTLIFPYDGLLDELTQFGRFGCGMGIESLPMTLLEDDEVADLDEINADNVLTDVWAITPFHDEAKQKRIASIFKHAIDRGYIR